MPNQTDWNSDVEQYIVQQIASDFIGDKNSGLIEDAKESVGTLAIQYFAQLSSSTYAALETAENVDFYVPIIGTQN